LKITQDEISLLRVELGGGKAESEAIGSALANGDLKRHIANVKQQSRHQGTGEWSGRGDGSSDPKDVEGLNEPATTKQGVQVHFLLWIRLREYVIVSFGVTPNRGPEIRGQNLQSRMILRR